MKSPATTPDRPGGVRVAATRRRVRQRSGQEYAAAGEAGGAAVEDGDLVAGEGGQVGVAVAVEIGRGQGPAELLALGGFAVDARAGPGPELRAGGGQPVGGCVDHLHRAGLLDRTDGFTGDAGGQIGVPVAVEVERYCGDRSPGRERDEPGTDQGDGEQPGQVCDPHRLSSVGVVASVRPATSRRNHFRHRCVILRSPRMISRQQFGWLVRRMERITEANVVEPVNHRRGLPRTPRLPHPCPARQRRKRVGYCVRPARQSATGAAGRLPRDTPVACKRGAAASGGDDGALDEHAVDAQRTRAPDAAMADRAGLPAPVRSDHSNSAQR